MKKLTALALVIALSLSMVLSGCGKQKETETGDRLARIKAAGTITIAMEGTWAPWTYHDEDDKLVGFDTEVGQKIAEKLGVTATFVEGEWDGLFAGLESGRYDLIINGVDITSDRQEKYDFTTPYAYNHTVLIVKSDNEEIKTFEDLKGKTTCNSINSTYMMLAEEYGATCQGVDSLEETLMMVLAGRVDATLNGEDSFYDYMSVHPEAELKVAAVTSDPTEVAIPIQKGDDTKTLVEAINKAIAELRTEGVLTELSNKYFGRDITNK